MTTCHQPSGLTKGLEFLIDSDWTPEQAFAVVELLEALGDRILAYYQLLIMALMREERSITPFDDMDTINLWGEDEPPF